jgi:hypothetical protein
MQDLFHIREKIANLWFWVIFIIGKVENNSQYFVDKIN